MENRFYIAYGSNLNKTQMAERCPGAKVAGTAVLKDYRLMFKGSLTGSYLTIEEEEGCSVPVGVWQVTAGHERNLDLYEGFPTFYYKKDMRVSLTDDASGLTREVEAFAYIMHEDRSHGVPTRRYVNTCLEGYRDFGFDPSVLTEAVSYSMARAAEEDEE